MPGERYFNSYRNGDWSTPSDDPGSPWHDGGDQTAAASTPKSGFGSTDADNPDAGDTVVIEHHVSVDVDAAAGNSPQGTPPAPVAFSASGGSAVTRLATGTYRASYAIRGENGLTGVGLSESDPVSIVHGVSKPRVTFPAAPPSGCDYRLYLSQVDGTQGTGQAYCVGITGSYVDLKGDKYNNVYSNGVADGGTYSPTTFPVLPDYLTDAALILSAGGVLTIEPGKSLTLRGNLVVEPDPGNTDDRIVVNSGARFGFDASLAVAPAHAEYDLSFLGTGKIAYRD